MEINQKYCTDNVIVEIEEDLDAYWYAMKDKEKIYFAILIKVFEKNSAAKKGSKIAEYGKSWVEETSLNSVNFFIKSFLENPEKRKEYLLQGEGFDEKINYAFESGVNKKCKESIDKFYCKKESNRKFKDFLNLKTFGLDKFSKMKEDTLKNYVLERDLEEIKSIFLEEKSVLSCLRWIARGLRVKDAIRKVKTDLEVAENAKC